MIEAGLIAARFAHYAALVLAFGALAYASYGERSDNVRRSMGRLGFASSLVLLLAVGAVLAMTVAGLGGSLASLSDPTLWSAVIQETDFGRVWLARLLMALALVAVGLAVWRRPLRALNRLGLLFASGLVVTIALTGHAQVEEGASGLVHRIADAAHLVAAAVWLGALTPLLFLLGTSASGTAEDSRIAAARLQGFHSVGLAAVLVLVLTGIVNSWFLVGSPERLVTTTYGVVLLAKVVLFAVMVGLAADNRLRLVPALKRGLNSGVDARDSLAQLRKRIRGELALGMLVLLAVAVLGGIAPASA